MSGADQASELRDLGRNHEEIKKQQLKDLELERKEMIEAKKKDISAFFLAGAKDDQELKDQLRDLLGQDEAMLTRPTHATPDQQLAALDVARTLERALKEMSPEIAQVVRMRLLEGVPFKEIARRQGVPLNTALGRMHRALKHLRSDLIDAHLIQGSTP